MKEVIINDFLNLQSKSTKTLTRDEYIKKSKFTKKEVDTAFGSFRNLKTESFGYSSDKFGSTELEKVEDKNTVTFSSKSYEIKTVDELLAYAEVDINEYEITKTVVNVWGSKTNPCYQVKAWLSRKTPEQVNAKKLLEDFRIEAEKYSTKKYSTILKPVKNKSISHLLEISIQDVHFGQLSWKGETDKANYDIKIAEKLMVEAVTFFMQSAIDYNIEEVLFPVGSDFFNVNSALNTTVKGTIQDEDCRWQKSFHKGVMLLVSCIDTILYNTTGMITVPVIYGNHDHERTYYAGEFLLAWYKNNKRVIIDNQPTPRKYYRYHSNLIGYTHGDNIKIDRLPLIMATETPDKWEKTTNREWHIGHLHHKKTHIYNTDLEENGIRVKTIPSLVAIDAWHNLKGYNAMRECPAFIWDKLKGNFVQFNYKV